MSDTISRNIFLIGPMGSGKTAVGRQLARQLKLEFVDSDAEIEHRTGVDIPYIFEKEGEEGFSAREARVINFIDRALTTFAKNSQAAYTKGIDELQAQTKQLFPTATKFSALTGPQQIQVLTAMEKTPFFNTVRTHTIIGFFASPVHGGNQDKIGWKLIGYDDSLNHRPPFGYYDAQDPAGRR